MASPIQHIAVCGHGIVAYMTALALIKRLPESIDVSLIGGSTSAAEDIFFGNVTSPSAYAFLLSLGVTEPELLLETNTTFSLGTKFQNWGPEKLSWTQAFYNPLPIHHGVSFHHYVKRYNAASQDWSLAPYIMSIEAANRGVFAHPPEGNNIPLASVEYGYHFDPAEWSKLIKNKLKASRLNIIETQQTLDLNAINARKSLTIDNGREVTADLFIDCSAQQNHGDWDAKPELHAMLHTQGSDKIERVVRTLTETDRGWHADTPLRDYVNTLTICDIKDVSEPQVKPSEQATLKTGRVGSPWENNILKLGHCAGTLAPLSPAPMMLLERDIERLIELIPNSSNMRVEAREYNRRFALDFDHAEMFHRAMFNKAFAAGSNFRKQIEQNPITTALAAKITQFETRGVCVNYDNEPFREQDWVLLHFGQKRLPARYDPLTDRVPEAQIGQMLDNMSKAISHMGSKMPPIDNYMSGLLRFLKEKHG